jgi:pimeloyl-ACP methyl ester carboxylesterase
MPAIGSSSTIAEASAVRRIYQRGAMTESPKRSSLPEPLHLSSVDGVPLDAVGHPAVGPSLGAVVQLHGITADRDEGGMFVRLADRLAESGMTVIRLSFRGHGKSGGTQRGMTIAGEMLDLQAAVEHTSREHPDRLSIVAASFGAVSTALSLPYLDDRLTALVLWNPVLDLRRTFLDPELPWGRENFGPEQQEILRRQGHLCVDGEFQLGRVLFEEFRTYRPDEHFANSVVPALVIHGDRDTYVSYDIAMASANARRNCDFHTVRGSIRRSRSCQLYCDFINEVRILGVASGLVLRQLAHYG